jgi:hypothetical protein
VVRAALSGFQERGFSPGEALSMLFRYQSGEAIEKGDRVTLFGEPCRIEFVVTRVEDDAWHFETYGGGIMICENREFGRLFLAADDLNMEEYEHKNLKFVSRG